MATKQKSTDGVLSGRARTWALAGLFLSMFVSMIAMNVVGTSMPVIIADIGGTQGTFTWVVMGTSLASAISTPIWGKLADLTSKKMLVQVALVIFTLGSILAGLAQDPTWLIVCRVFQGLGVGGLGALNQIVLAEIVSPRERGKYMGIMGAIMAVATVGGPLIGGAFTDSIGWRWNFYLGVPLAIAAIVMLQYTLHLHVEKQRVKIDYAGAVFISVGFSSLLVWVTLGGSAFAWLSWQTALMVAVGIACLAIAVMVELKSEEPLIPLTLFKNRTFTLSVIASLAVGIALFATIVYLGQYMQLARGRSVIESSLLTLPMMGGVLASSTIAGQLITRTGKWKRYVVTGAALLLIGTALLGQLRYDTTYWYVGVAMFVLGCGIGMTMQNLVLIVQNTVAPTQIGAASSAVNFFRTIGGSAGMSAMGTLLVGRLEAYMPSQGELQQMATEAIERDPGAAETIQSQLQSLAAGAIPKVNELPEAIRIAVESAYGHGIGNVFLATAPVAVIALIAVIFLPNIPLSSKSNAERMAEQRKGLAEEFGEQADAFAEAATGTIPTIPTNPGEEATETRKSEPAL